MGVLKMEDKKPEVKETKKEELTKKELQTLANVLVNTPTQNLQTAQQLILLSNKVSRMIDLIK